MILPVVLYGILFAVAVFAPLRWSVIAYLLLSTVDFSGDTGDIGLLNAAKGIALPLYLLWRLRAYAGHERTIIAPIAWLLLALYAGIGAFWSFFPISALKLAGHMIGSLLICFVFLRASKGGYLTSSVVLPVAIGALAIAGLRSIFMPHYGDEAVRFTAFSSAQSFGAFLVALYSLAICSKTLRPATRISLCIVLAVALILDGSRIWAIGLLLTTLFALLVSSARPWLKVCVTGLVVVTAAVAVGSADRIISVLARDAESNRIAAAVAAFYQGDVRSYGLGTYQLRRGFFVKELDAIRGSSMPEWLFGHGTSNGVLVITGAIFKAGTDPNRLMHDEWLRVMYEWGLIGFGLWLLFLGSIVMFAWEGMQRDREGNAKPLLIYIPAFLLGLAGENIIAGAGNAVSVGFLLLIGLAGISHRKARRYVLPRLAVRLPVREQVPVLQRSSTGRSEKMEAGAG